MKNTTRALRRYHRRRMINRAKIVQKHWWWFSDSDNTKAIHKMAAKFADNIAICSCQMCRNPRHCDWLCKDEKLTMPERKALISYEQQMDDYESDNDSSTSTS